MTHFGQQGPTLYVMLSAMTTEQPTLSNTFEATLSPNGIAATYARAPLHAWGAAVEGMARFWSSAIDRRATPLGVLDTAHRWMQSAFERKPPTWSTPHQVVREWPIARLRDFSVSSSSNVVPVLVLPPQAGHDSCVVDFAPGQSQIETIRNVGLDTVASLDWIGATHATKDTTVEDYLAVIADAIGLLGGRVNLIGDCQGGWLGTIYAARYPETVHTLTIAGAPIDTHCGTPQLQQWLVAVSPTRNTAAHRMLVAMHGGILPGRYQLAGFKAMEPAAEFERVALLLGNAHDEDDLAHYAKFADWFEHTQDISGAFYLWTVEHLFARNELVAGNLRVAGQRVDLSAIQCPIYMIAGDRDHITPAEQVWSLEQYVSTDPQDMTRRLASAGHLGLFMGRHALQDHWTPALADVLRRSALPR
jgi:poly(3-hydroxybutyrate) depolymerase